MKLLRTVSTGRLLAVIAALVVAVGAGTALAVAASGPGPVPKRESLAKALHQAVAAPAAAGITARIAFTNNLIGSADLAGSQASDPILSGATTGRLWLTGHRLRLELQSTNGDAEVVLDNRSFWISDPASHTVYEGTLPAESSSAAKHAGAKQAGAKSATANGIPTIAQIQSDLNRLVKNVNLSGAIPSDVAGRPAYTVRVAPRHDGGLLASAQLAWDAFRGVPVRIAIYARNNPMPVLELKATHISFGRVHTSNFNVSPPAGSKIVKIATAAHAKALSSKSKLGQHGRRANVSGVAAVASQVPFKFAAPRSLVGLPRHAVKLLSWGGKAAALVVYGQNLGAIAVIEQTESVSPTSAGKSSGQSGNGQSPLSLPTVSINGATGHELDTALGTVLTFNRGGVGYTVIGSVPSAAAVLAARAL